MDDATLTRSPENTFSKALLPYAKGTVTETRIATASNYQRRDGIAPNSNVKSAERASRLAREFLRQHKQEEDIVECEIEVPGGAVNLVHAGDRIACQFGHWGPEGYAGWTYFRVLERRVKPLLRDDPPSVYRIGLRLSPQEPAEPQCAYARTESGVFYPLGDNGDGTNIHPNYGGPVIYYLRPGIFYPVAPMENHESLWHFPRYGAGGAGTTDYAGDCAQNTLQFIVVGDGTGVLQSKVFDTGTRPMSGTWGPPSNPYQNSLGIWDSGASKTITITGTSAPNDCVRVIRIGDGPGSCGGAWGWSSFTWTQS